MTPSTPVASPSLSAGCLIRSTALMHRGAANFQSLRRTSILQVALYHTGRVDMHAEFTIVGRLFRLVPWRGYKAERPEEKVRSDEQDARHGSLKLNSSSSFPISQCAPPESFPSPSTFPSLPALPPPRSIGICPQPTPTSHSPSHGPGLSPDKAAEVTDGSTELHSGWRHCRAT